MCSRRSKFVLVLTFVALSTAGLSTAGAGAETTVIDLASQPANLTWLAARSVLASGDLNGDRADDLVLELRSNSTVAVVLGGQTHAPAETIDLRAHQPDVKIVAPFRIWAVLVSDISGDGIGDLVLTDGTDWQQVVVIYGRYHWPDVVDLRTTAPDVSIGGLFNSRFLWWAAPEVGSGDFNGDGRLDLAVGAPGRLCSGFGAEVEAGGAVFLFWSRDQEGRLPSNVPEAETQADASFCAPCFEISAFGLECPQLGNALAAPDLDGDGRADLSSGAHFSQLGQDPHAGVVHIFHGRGPGRPFPRRTDVLPGSGDIVIEGADLEFHTPERLLAADFSQDGLGDLFVVSASSRMPGSPERVDAGETRLLLGARKPSGGRRFIDYAIRYGDWNAFGAEPLDRAERIAAGDADGDGHADVLIGAAGAAGPANTRPRRPGFLYGSGEAYLFRGRSFGPSEAPIILDLSVDPPDLIIYGSSGWVPPRREGDGVGGSVALADFDGDGFEDLILGEPGIPPPENPGSTEPIGAVVMIRSPFAP